MIPSDKLGSSFNYQDEFRMIEEMMQFESKINHGKFSRLLSELKSGDEIKILEASQQLSVELSMTQDISTVSFNIDNFVPNLVHNLEMTGIPDIPLYSIICLNHILDLNAASSRRIVDCKGADSLLNKLQNLDDIEIGESALSLLRKISTKNGQAILISPGFPILFLVQEFFISQSQKDILTIVVNAVKCLKTKEEYETIVSSFDYDFINFHIQDETKFDLVIEFGAHLIGKIIRIYQNDYLKKREVIEKLLSSELFQNAILRYLKLFNASMSTITLEYCLQILNKTSLMSCTISQLLLNKDLILEICRILQIVLSMSQDQGSTLQMEIINFINALLATKKQPEDLIIKIAGLLNIEVIEQPFYQEKIIMLKANKKILVPLYKIILNNARIIMEKNKEFLHKYITLICIDKILQLIENESLENYVPFNYFAEILSVNFKEKDIMIISIMLLISKSVINQKSQLFLYALHREGFFEKINDLTSDEYLKTLRLMSHPNIQQVKTTAKPPLLGKPSSNNFIFDPILNKLAKEMMQLSNEGQKIEDMEELMEKIEKIKQSMQLQEEPKQSTQGETMKSEGSDMDQVLSDIKTFAMKLCENYSELSKSFNLAELVKNDNVSMAKITKLMETGNYMNAFTLMKEFIQEQNGISLNQLKDSGIIEIIVNLCQSENENKNFKNCGEILQFLLNTNVVTCELTGNKITTSLFQLLVKKAIDHINEHNTLNFSMHKDVLNANIQSLERLHQEIKYLTLPCQVRLNFKIKRDYKQDIDSFMNKIASEQINVNKLKLESYIIMGENLLQVKRNLFQQIGGMALQVEKFSSLKKIQRYLFKNIEQPEDVLPNLHKIKPGGENDIRPITGLVQYDQEEEQEEEVSEASEEEPSMNNLEAEENQISEKKQKTFLQSENKKETSPRKYSDYYNAEEIDENTESLQENIKKYTNTVHTLSSKTQNESKGATKNFMLPTSIKKSSSQNASIPIESKKKFYLDPSTRDVSSSHYIKILFYINNILIDSNSTLIEIVKDTRLLVNDSKMTFDIDFALKLSDKTLRIVSQDNRNYNSSSKLLTKTTDFDTNFQMLNFESKNKISKIKQIDSFTTSSLRFLALMRSYDENIKNRQSQTVPFPQKIINNIRTLINKPINIATRKAHENLPEIITELKNIIPFDTRLLFFKLTDFDISKRLYFYSCYNKKLLKDFGSLKISRIHRKKHLVDRTHILESFLHVFLNTSYKHVLQEFAFIGEEGTGLGPTLEFYSLVCKEVCNPAKKIFTTLSQNTLWPDIKSTRSCEEIISIYKALGMMCSRAIIDDRVLDLPLALPFWDLVFGRPISYDDFFLIDENLGRFINDLVKIRDLIKTINLDSTLDMGEKSVKINQIKYKGKNLESLEIYFILPGNESVEIVPGGNKILLTLENIQEYLENMLKTFFIDSVRLHVDAFKRGFFKYVKLDKFNIFATEEIDKMINGEQGETWTFDLLKEAIIPSYGYTATSPSYTSLLEVMCEMTAEQQRDFLSFVTGSPKLPLGGIKALKPQLSVVKREIQNQISFHIDETLPSVMTCQNYLKLPEYSTKEVLKEKLFYAMKEGKNNFTLS